MKNRIVFFAITLFFCVFTIIGISIKFVNELKERNEISKNILQERIAIKSIHQESQKLLKSALLFSRGNKIQSLEEFYDAKANLNRITIEFSDPKKQRELERIRESLLTSVAKLISSEHPMDSVAFELSLNEVVTLSKSLELSENAMMVNLEMIEAEANKVEKDEIKYSILLILLVTGLALLVVYIQIKRGAKLVLDLESDKDEVQVRLQESARLALLGEMSASIAHEIKNPLTVLVGRFNVLKRRASAGNGFSVAEQIEFADKASAMVMRISRTIMSVQRAARNEVSERSELSIHELLKENFDLCVDKAVGNRVELTEVNESQMDLVFGNSVELSQVFLNLINNGIDATESLEHKWVKVIVSNTESQCQIRIVDSGLGIPKEVQKKLFKNFFTTKPVGKGTGLGLAICQRIVEAHGGTIAVDNEASNTTFVVSLPLARKT